MGLQLPGGVCLNYIDKGVNLARYRILSSQNSSQVWKTTSYSNVAVTLAVTPSDVLIIIGTLTVEWC